MTILGKLVAKQEEFGGYVTYVFRNLETNQMYDKYITCTRYPNWEGSKLDLDEEGYLTFEEHIAGEDSWYDGQSKLQYKFNHIQFVKFVPLPKDNSDNTIIL